MALRRFRYLLFLLVFCGTTTFGQYLVENKGQWDARALLKLPMHCGAVYFEQDGLRVHLIDPEGPAFDYQKHHHESDGETHPAKAQKLQQAHTYRMHWLHANPEATLETGEKLPTYHNYLLGNDKSKWQSKVPLYMTARYRALYPGIDLRFYFNQDAHLKYDIEIAPGADYTLYKTAYEGADSLWLKEGVLHIETTVGEVQELKPYAYQYINGEQREVRCDYVLKGKTVYFKLGRYDRSEKLVIDPELVFSSFIPSTSNVFGYTATYSANGDAYGGGIVFGESGTVPTLGAFQDTFQGGGLDITISKISADGGQLLFSTYLGGSGIEMPYSLIEGSDSSLYIFGNTGSDDFPVSANAYLDTFSGGPLHEWYGSTPNDTNFQQGVDLFVARISKDGGSLLGSTYFGGTDSDGLNEDLILHSGDKFRGEITLDEMDHVYIIGSTKSNDIPLVNNNLQTTQSGKSDVLLASFSSDLSTLRWGTYYGSTESDIGFSISVRGNTVFAAGASNGSLPFMQPSSYSSSRMGAYDGFILTLDRDQGTLINSTYTGGTANDANFFIDADDQGNVYTFGLSKSNLPGSNPDFFNQPNTEHLIQQYSPDLSQLLKSTTFGNNLAVELTLSPAAFEVDDCNNILLSGWGRVTNLFTTPNALKKVNPSSDGNDFYFLILDASWKKVNYATYFGASSGYGEHIDGGTSRFAPDGTIYQGICAACQDSSNAFPTTPNAYGTSKGAAQNDCNLAVVKFSTDAQEVTAQVTPLRDTVCQFTSVRLIDSSYNADTYRITNPDGSSASVDSIGEVFITKLGLNKFYIKAIDTTCGGADSIEVNIYGIDFSNEAEFELNYDSCIVSPAPLQVQFTSFYGSSFQGIWDFGDGDSSTSPSPTHTYPAKGTYTVTLYVSTSACPGTLSQSKTFTLHPIEPLTVDFSADQCIRTTANLGGGGLGYQQYIWLYADGSSDTGNSVSKDFIGQDGTQIVRCIALDTICNRSDTLSKSITLNFIDRPVAFPNVFTPNGDGVNDEFGLLGDIDPKDFRQFNIQIFNRWGALIYSSNEVTNKWDGTEDKGVLPPGVYFYVVDYLSSCNLNERKQGFVHLIR